MLQMVVNQDGVASYELTADTVLEMNPSSRIDAIKRLLAETDYQAIKHAEGWISDEEYAPIRAQRQEWRNEINSLEENS